MIQAEPYGPEWVNVAAQQEDPGSLWHTLQRMIAVRKSRPAFGQGSMTWLDSPNPAVAGYWRRYWGERLLILNNLSGEIQKVAIPVKPDDGLVLKSLLDSSLLQVPKHGELELTLSPYGYLWLELVS
ncbi:MAG: trehalose synthase [Chloroflexi bacterium]|nr:trehalose synthase [Chloroflexota bacterium]